MTSAISYPYTIDIFGNAKASTDTVKIYLDRVLTLLSTNIGQRPILQDYGTDVMRALFENDNNISLAIDQAVRRAIARWIPEIEVESITVGQVDREGNATVVINLIMPDNSLTSVSLSSATFNIDGTVTR